MPHTNENTKWKFTVPDAGEVDSVENYNRHVEEIDKAIPDPTERFELYGKGEPPEPPVETDTYYKDEYLSGLAGHDVWVTTSHVHPTPASTPEADHATESTHSENSDHASEADKLVPGATINGHQFDGTEDIEIKSEDIKDLRRVFYGTELPEDHEGFPDPLLTGDIYCQYV